MSITRRGFLKLAGSAGLGALAAPLTPVSAMAETPNSDNASAMLYDSTKCVGCRACQMACKRENNLPPETDSRQLYEMPVDLSAKTWTMIKLYKGAEGTAFIKNQCMHCLEPACVSVCPVAALQKKETGPVIYESERCIGCRYCMAACPFGIPKTDWETAYPLIHKCDFCASLQAEGQEPACSAACPTSALIFGPRKDMLEIAHSRIQSDPSYIKHVYGESEVGGTSMLYISGTSFNALGFPTLGSTPLPELDWPYLKAVPAVIATMVTLSTAIYLRTHREENKKVAAKLAEEA